MEKNFLSTTFLGRILARTRGFYLTLAVFIAQLGPSLLVIPVALFVQGNAEFAPAQARQLGSISTTLIIICNVVLMIWAFIANREARHRMRELTRPAFEGAGSDDTRAWRQITSFSWRYGIVLGVASLVVCLLPLIGYSIFGLNATSNQLIYLVMGGFVSICVTLAQSVLLVELILAPARRLLMPAAFENQMVGSAGARILIKFMVVIFIMVLVSVLLVAPVGYHSTLTILLGGIIGTGGALRTLQFQILIAAIVALALGLELSLLLSRSFSDPIHEIISVLDKVEKGDLKQRTRVNSTDEVGELAMHFNHMIARLDELQGSLESEVAQRTEQLKATIEVSRVASTILDPDELVTKIVNLITDRFGYYYCAIFIIDNTGQWAVLKEASGLAGKELKAQKHRLPLGGKSMVSTAVATRQPRIALDVGAEPVRFENPLLPETRSEIALPLTIAGHIFGVLDVQSRKEAAFGEQDVDTLQGMANSVATALENARLFRETQTNLAELRIAQKEYVTKAWSETSQKNESYDYAAPEAVATSEELSVIDVPISLREQIIGQLHLEGQHEWTSEERSLVEAVATQAALAMENSRLLEESRKMALRERIASEIIGKIWSSPTTDLILQTAIKELGRALNADEAIIELKSE